MASFLAVCLGAITAHAWPGDTRFQVEFKTCDVWQSRNGERFAFGWYNFAVVSLGVRF